MNLRNLIRKIILESIDEQVDFGDPAKAKRAIIALSKGLIPKTDINYFKGSLSPQYPEETGPVDQEGDVEISFKFEGDEYSYYSDIFAEFYYNEGDSGDDWTSPTSGDYDDEKILIPDTQLSFGDSNGNEYNFELSELPSSFREDMESFLVDFYDPIEGSIGF